MLLKPAMQRKQFISITPLIDVVFILLLFFMLTSTFQHYKQIEMKTLLPGTQLRQKEPSHKLLVDINDVIFMDGVKYSFESHEFEKQLTEFAKSNDKVTLAAIPKVKIQRFIQVLDRVRAAGITNLNISKTELP